jgi:hypothetical protein
MPTGDKLFQLFGTAKRREKCWKWKGANQILSYFSATVFFRFGLQAKSNLAGLVFT